MADKAPTQETLFRSENLQQWQTNTCDPAVARAPLRKTSFQTSAEIPLPDLFSPPDAADFPGEYPFLRGIQPTMYRGRLWTMRQYAGFGNAVQSNERYKFLLQAGQTGLSVAFDLPTQMGRDSDHALSRGEVGRTGVAVSSLDDMRTLLDGLPLDAISTSMTINATAATLLALYVAVADERGVPRAKLSGTIQNDILKEYIARGTYVYPPAPSMRLVSDVFAFCRVEVPRWNTISISGYHIREAGSDAVQEVAFTLADGIAYVQAAERAQLPVDSFAPRLSFFFNAHSNLLEEVAKFRAARRLWAKIMRDRFKAQDPRSCMLRFHAQTAGSTLTASQPMNNVVRTTVEAMAAILGGAQSLHANGFDEALSLPTEEAAQLALRTQQVLAHESGIADVVDPFGGSYVVESLTDTIEARAAELIARIDEMGGMLRAIEAGFPQREIENRAYAHQRAVEQGQRIIVGENAFQDGKTAGVPSLHRQDPVVEREQCERLAAFRARRNAQNASEALSALTNAARGTENLMPAILSAVKAEATLGEIADALRSVFGTHR